jgi:ABC-type multidrug transport system ATPase subunit
MREERVPDPQPTVVLDGVTRSFSGARGVDDLSLTVPAGTVTVLLGPNGAGKTTTIRLITGALAPDAGIVRTFGLDPATHGQEIRTRTGVVPPKPALYERLSGRANLRYAAALWDLPRTGIDRRIDDVAGRFGIVDALDRTVGGYSTGMRTRLAVARAVLADPDLLLLDEPTAGLDPESARAVLSLVHDLARAGTTIVLCTHLLHEADGLADQVVLVHGGTAAVAGSPAALAASVLPDAEVVLDAEDPDLLHAVAPGLAGVRGYEAHAGRDVHRTGAASIRLTSAEVLPDVVAALVAAGVRLTRVDPRTPSLEDLYFALRDADPRLPVPAPTNAPAPAPAPAPEAAAPEAAAVPA